jgi:hypothetical protein
MLIHSLFVCKSCNIEGDRPPFKDHNLTIGSQLFTSLTGMMLLLSLSTAKVDVSSDRQN